MSELEEAQKVLIDYLQKENQRLWEVVNAEERYRKEADANAFHALSLSRAKLMCLGTEPGELQNEN